MKRVLFADNDATLLKNRSAFLEGAGYEVLRANSPEQAQQLLEEYDVHLIITDIRLLRDRDPHDISGLLLAKDLRYRAVPKIVLTRYPTYEAVREVLGLDVEGLAPPAARFLAKQEGLEVMLQAVNDIFARHVRINWELTIEFDERYPLSFPHLIMLTEPGLKTHRLADRATELESLFRRLFHFCQRIRLDRLLWQRDGRFAVTVWAFAKGQKPEGRVVIGGLHPRAAEDRERYRIFAPAAPGQNSTVWKENEETLHFGANVYALADADLPYLTPLTEAWYTLPEKNFHNVLHFLFVKTLTQWQQGGAVVKENDNDLNHYRHLSGLTLGRTAQNTFEARLRHILGQCLALGIEGNLDSEKLQVRLGKQVFTYSNPALELYGNQNDQLPAILNYAPGVLSGDNILTDSEGRTWLTDFTDAGWIPSLWNYAVVEALIRFDWIENEAVAELHEMERCLVSDNFDQWDASDVTGVLRKSLRAIQVIRRLVAAHQGDPRSYHRAMLFLVAKRLTSLNQTASPQVELIRLMHLFLASGMISDLLCKDLSDEVSPALITNPGIYIDKGNRVVFRDGIRLMVRGQSYDLLLGLYENAGGLCTHKQIAETFLGDRVFDGDESRINRLNTAVRRLREKIEYDPNHPKFLLTDAGGYRLKPRLST